MDKKQVVLRFDGIDDYLEFSQDFPLIKNEITIEFWAKGENDLSQKTSVVEACNSAKHRALNINIPWECTVDSHIFWDAGNENGYDRIDKSVGLIEYNTWTHWAFVKDATIGKMWIYRNGEMWCEGSGKNKSLAGIKKFFIGCSANLSNHWKGYIAEFRIWHQARTEKEIRVNMNLALVGDEPGLSAYLPLNGDVNDKTSYNNNAIIYGTTWIEESMSIKKRKPRNQSDNQQITEVEIATDMNQENLTESPSTSGEEDEQIITTTESPSTSGEEDEQIITTTEKPFTSGEEDEQIITTTGTSLTEEVEQTIATTETSLTEETEQVTVVSDTSFTREIDQSIAVNPDNEQPHQSPVSSGKKKRLVVCCDGTWHELASSDPTNVLKLARLVKYTADDQTPQLVFYSSGFVREDDNIPDLIDRLGDSAFRWGIDRLIQDAYRFLSMNYDAEAHDEIYLFGFSRGAYIVRCLAGMIYKCGLLRRSKIQEIRKAYELYRNNKFDRDSLEAQEFRQENSKKVANQLSNFEDNIPIKMLGCWETVGTLGIPDVLPWPSIEKIWNINYEFYDATLSPIVENAFQAVAIDEKRKVFPSTPLKKSDKNPNQVVEEVWFAGDHNCVGGGNKEYRGLSDYPLQWMLQKAQKLGLEFYPTENESEDFQIKPDPTTYFDNTVAGVYLLRGEGWRSIDSSPIVVHSSVVKRLKACPEYRPENLKSVIQSLLSSD